MVSDIGDPALIKFMVYGFDICIFCMECYDFTWYEKIQCSMYDRYETSGQHEYVCTSIIR